MVKFNEKECVNKVVLKCYSVLAAVLFVAYLLELIKGNRSFGYIVIFDLILLVPLIIGWICFRQDAEADIIKRVVSCGYGLMYVFVLLTGVSKITFVYILPMLVVLTLYRDWRYILRFGVIMTIVNVVYALYYLIAISDSRTDLTEFEIVIAVVILITYFAVLASKVLTEISEQSVAVLQEKEENNMKLLNTIIKSTEMLGVSIHNISEESERAGQGMTTSRESISNIASGTTETAESIQKQMEMTSDISSRIAGMSEVTELVLKECQNSNDNIKNGIANMDVLLESSRELGSSNQTVVSSMNLLEEKAQSVGVVISLISNIADQTEMLSLNASIEAARAGESGRGFSVVAEEIRRLSDQTQEAVEDIQKIITELGEETQNATDSVNAMVEISNQQVDYIARVNDNFKTLENSISNLSMNIQKQSDNMSSINRANTTIMHSIEGLSSFSEELMASTELTRTQSEESYESILQINNLIELVREDIDRLNEVTIAKEQ